MAFGGGDRPIIILSLIHIYTMSIPRGFYESDKMSMPQRRTRVLRVRSPGPV